jgi:hypothetical protein
MKDVPRAQAEMRLDHEGEAPAEEREADIEIEESTNEHTFRVRPGEHQLRLRFLA